MVRLLIPIAIALAVFGAVLGVAAVMLVFLGQDWEDALFWILAAVMLGSGLLVVTMRDIIRCGLAMIVCFGALAGIYVLIGSPLIGAAQAGAAAVASIVIAVVVALAVSATDWGPAAQRISVATDALSQLLFSDFVFPFEIVSVLLLAAVIGSVYLAKREPGGPS
jgi:NADH-quinone oxidoreductase subunit J